MGCDVCKEGDAVIQLTEIEGTGVRLLHLCERCAAERGVETTAAPKPQISDFLQSVHQAMQATQGELRGARSAIYFRDFRSTAGWIAQCYDASRRACATCCDAFMAARSTWVSGMSLRAGSSA